MSRKNKDNFIIQDLMFDIRHSHFRITSLMSLVGQRTKFENRVFLTGTPELNFVLILLTLYLINFSVSKKRFSYLETSFSSIQLLSSVNPLTLIWQVI